MLDHLAYDIIKISQTKDERVNFCPHGIKPPGLSHYSPPPHYDIIAMVGGGGYNGKESNRGSHCITK